MPSLSLTSASPGCGSHQDWPEIAYSFWLGFLPGL
jgi:hypothetical protein